PTSTRYGASSRYAATPRYGSKTWFPTSTRYGASSRNATTTSWHATPTRFSTKTLISASRWQIKKEQS
ncbi:hypothetical protein, partial [Mycoplasmoides pneumoniae]|uniref:hypothetical protein n=3 Tax=Mycoplasmoides pneumoniae TaxID=2104 RepID=UPI0027E0010A